MERWKVIRARSVRTPASYDPDEVSLETGVRCVGEGLTVQAEVVNTDINSLVKRFGISRELPVPAAGPAEFGDFSQVVDFQTAMNQVVLAKESFMSLPPKVRERFRNDPGELWSWLHDAENADRNLEEAYNLGLIARPPAAPVTTAESSAGVEGGSAQ